MGFCVQEVTRVLPAVPSGASPSLQICCPPLLVSCTKANWCLCLTLMRPCCWHTHWTAYSKSCRRSRLKGETAAATARPVLKPVASGWWQSSKLQPCAPCASCFAQCFNSHDFAFDLHIHMCCECCFHQVHTLCSLLLVGGACACQWVCFCG